MNAIEVLHAAHAAGVRVGVVGASLELDADRAPPDELLEEIRRFKPEILALLSEPAPEFSRVLKAHKADPMSALSAGEDVDWNDHSATPPTDPFTREAIQDIKAGKAVPVWSAVLGEWLWFVKDKDAQQKLVDQGCQSPIYTLGELAVVADMRLNSSFGPEDLRRVHAIKKKFGAAIKWPPNEAG